MLDTPKVAECWAKACQRRAQMRLLTSLAASIRALTRFVTELPTQVSGSMVCVTESAPSFGQMAVDTKASGVMIRRTARESWCTLTAISTKATG